MPDATRLRNRLLKKLLWRYVVSDHRMATQQHGQQRVVRDLINAYATAAMPRDEQNLSIFPEHTRRSSRALTHP